MPPAAIVRHARLLACLLAPIVASCGASQSTSSAGATTTPAEAPLPPLPSSAVDLLPAALDGALRVDVAGLRKSPLWAYGVEAAQKRCVAIERFEVLLQRTDVVVGGALDAKGTLGAAVLQGKLEPTDVDTLLGLLLADPARAPAVQTRTEGRFQVSERAPVAASVLGSGLAVVGDAASLRSVLDVADGKAPNAREGLLSGGLGQAIGFETAGIAVIYRPTAEGRAQLERQLGRGGRAALPPGLLQSSRGALAVHLGEPLELRAAVESASAAEADELTRATQSSLMQLNLLLRLAGLPPLLERLTAQTQGTLSVFSLQIGSADLDVLWSRMRDLLAAEAQNCGEVKL